MASEVYITSGGTRNAVNAIRERLPRPLTPTKRKGSRNERILPDLKPQDIITTRENFEGGGSLTVLAERTNEGLASKSNIEVYRKEKKMSRILAKNGHEVTLRQSSKKGDTYDVDIDGGKADLKWLTSPKYMMKHAKKATTQQGAQKTIFMLNGRFGKYRGAIRKLQTKGYHGYYIRGEKVFEY